MNPGDKPWIVAHRGSSIVAPENTLAAIRLAWEQGADAVEVDLHLTRDGTVVVIHDATARRTTGADIAVAGSTLAELRALDAGRHKGPAYVGETIPTLREVLATVPAGRRIFLELKAGPELLGPLARDLAAAHVEGAGPALGDVFLITFNEEVARLAKARLRAVTVLWVADPRRLRRGEGVTGAVRRMIDTARRAGLDGLDLFAHPSLDAALISEAHAARLQLHVWTVNLPEEGARFVHAGADGITTDAPDVMLTVRARLAAGELSPVPPTLSAPPVDPPP